MSGATPNLRRAAAADSEACFRLFWDSISDLAARTGIPWEGTADDRPVRAPSTRCRKSSARSWGTSADRATWHGCSTDARRIATAMPVGRWPMGSSGWMAPDRSRHGGPSTCRGPASPGGTAAAIGHEDLGFEVPAPNVNAIRHLLERRFRIDPFVTYLMANRPFARFDRYLGFTPPFVL